MRQYWNNAAAEGWMADHDGQAFNAYYSPEGAEIHKNREQNRKEAQS